MDPKSIFKPGFLSKLVSKNNENLYLCCAFKYKQQKQVLGFVVVVIIWYICSWIYNYLCNQCLSQLTLWVWTLLRQGVLDTTLCDKVCQ